MILPFILATAAAAATDESLELARQALADGLPQVAVYTLETQSLPSEAHHILLGRALVLSGRPADATKVLEPLAAKSPEAAFWLGQALAAENRPEEALPHYIAASAPESPVRNEATLGAALLRARLGRPAEALETLAQVESWPTGALRNRALVERATLELAGSDTTGALRSLDAMQNPSDAEAMRRQFVRAQAMAASGDAAAAAALFAEVRPLNAGMAVDSIIGRADALRASGELSAAEVLLEDFIATHENLPGLGRVFEALDRVYSAVPNASTAELRRWTDAPEPSQRKSYALFYRAKREAAQNRGELARRLLGILIRTAPDHPLAPIASVELASARIQAGEFAEALEVLPPPGTEATADFLRGIALAGLDRAAEAIVAFRAASSDPEISEPALYNAALCAVRSGQPDHPVIAELRTRFPESPRLARLRFHEALDVARSNPRQAAMRLEALIEQAGPREASVAALALAELRFLDGNFQAARESLRQVATDVSPDRQAALNVFLADTGDPAATDAAIAAAQQFVKDFPDSPAEPDVRMKWGELLFRKGDFAAARLQFESLARRTAGTPLEETALFLAGQSASKLLSADALDDALLLFEEVAALNGSLAQRARLEQAILQSARGRTAEAVVILDRVVSAADSPEIRFAALIEKGKTLYLSGTPQGLEDAIAAWRMIATDPEASPDWRNQAWSRIGTAHEKLGRTDAALAAFYEVIRPGRDENPGLLWFYKAGFDAGRLLESAQRWEEAVRVYEMIAAVEGPRAAEARARINKIRLENFLWDGD
ncbi:MAG: tetratricopeptide repeat protein [Terrimicrobiaceae bacterium]|nr:tetratricopeptide repeat protein [Terrimicrobiaceae bacterium]